MKAHRHVRAAALWLAISLLGGCATYDIPPNRDPSGGALTDSEACLYDYDTRGFWYVMFVRRDGLMATNHRHSPGTHLFITPEGDLLFYSRGSGRGEVLDVMGRTLRLADGTVFLVDANGDPPRVVQLGNPAPRCDPADAEDVTRALYEISRDARVASFLSLESRLRIQADWQAAKKRKRQAKPP